MAGSAKTSVEQWLPVTLTRIVGDGPALARLARVSALLGRAHPRDRPATRNALPQLPGERRPNSAEFSAGRALMRMVAAELSGCPAPQLEFELHCAACDLSGHGKPHLVGHPDIDLSLSHTGGWVLVAGSTEHLVGVDLALPADVAFPGFDRTVLAPEELRERGRLSTEDRARDGLARWTAKESALKAAGVGLAVDPRQVIVAFPSADPRLVAWPLSRHPVANARLTTLDVGPGLHATLATLSRP